LGFAAAIWFFNLSIFGQPLFSPLDDRVELSPPSDYLTQEDILVSNDRVEILVENARIANYESTGSMSPLLNENTNGIVVLRDCNEIKIGDVVSYRKNGNTLVHRVVDFSENGDFSVKGDNAVEVDSVRCDEIVGVLVGVIY
jgi:hypothetical protein